MYVLSMVVAITGLVTYQIAMRAAPRGVNPFLLLTLAYLIAAVVCVPAAILWKRFAAPSESPISMSHVLPAAFIALAVLLIETGYMMIYRNGGTVSIAPIVSQAVTLTMLFLIGLAFLGETFTLWKTLGLALALGGVFLLSWKR